MTYKTIIEYPSEEQMHLAYVLGWCVEMLQGYCLIADDIMDRGTTRRGQPCWHLVDDMGVIALNDAFILEQAIYRLLQKYFRNSSHNNCYTELLDLFHEATYKTVMGHSLDTHTGRGGRNGNTGEFDMERYKAIVKYKTGYYTIYLPIALAMTLAGMRDDKDLFKEVESVSLLVGELLQARDDYEGCFGNNGDDSETGEKVERDIRNCKCSWLYVTAKVICPPDTFAELEGNYGLEDPVSVGRVKQIYIDIGIPEEYKSYKNDMYTHISELVSRIGRDSIKSAFKQLTDFICFR